jgi:COP9 signalosome complex subunit 2
MSDSFLLVQKASLRLELKLAKVLFENKDFDALEKKLEAMHKECQLPDGSDDPSKGNQLMDIYALEISMFSAKGNNRKLKELYERALKIKGLCNPRIAGIIHECGGKMHMRERNWAMANSDFFEAFKNYDDAGARKQSCQCLKYLVLANMLSGSDINPFHEQRAKSYQSNKEIEAMINLVDAYQRHDLKKFERELKQSKEAIMDDEFIADYIQDLMKKIRSEVLLDRIKPYTNITIPFIARELNVKNDDVVDLLVELILDGQVKGRIDQIHQILRLAGTKSSNDLKYQALSKWANQLNSLEKSVFGRLN